MCKSQKAPPLPELPAATPPPAVAAPDAKGAAAAPIAASAAPAATMTSPSVAMMQTDARRAAARKRGINSTILTGQAAGSSPGSKLGNSASGGTTMLGGG
jgi:hypothetical protein